MVDPVGRNRTRKQDAATGKGESPRKSQGALSAVGQSKTVDGNRRAARKRGVAPCEINVRISRERSRSAGRVDRRGDDS